VCEAYYFEKPIRYHLIMTRATNAMATFLTAALLLGQSATASAQSSPAGAARCRAENNFLSVAGTVHTRATPYFVEVELTVRNKSAASLWIDPTRITLVPDGGDPVAAAAVDQVLQTLRTPSPTYVDAAGIVVSGSFAFGVGIGPIDLRARALEARILRSSAIAGAAHHAGSVYFHPRAWPARFDLIVDGLRLGGGAPLAALPVRDCAMPARPETPPRPLAPPIPSARRTEISARAAAGLVTMTVSAVELARFATSLTVTVENASDREADLFAAFGRTRLIDDAGAAYALRILRSDLAERVPARGMVRGQLVFEPIPLDRTPPRVTLALPGVRVGDLVHDIAVVVPL
jgi:hypothetical protein